MGLLGCDTAHEAICRQAWTGFNSLIHPTWMGRTSWFRRFRYDPRLRKSQDRDILLRAYKESRFACLPEVLLGYRQETFDLKKLLKSRAYFSRLLAWAAMRHRDPRFVFGIGVQCVKAAVDVIARGAGFDYRQHRRRAVTISNDVAAEWRDVWARVHEPRED